MCKLPKSVLIFLLPSLAMTLGRARRVARRTAESELSGAICAHQLVSSDVEPQQKAFGGIGRHRQQITHQWSCSEEFGPSHYLLFVRNCEISTRRGDSELVVDRFGCPNNQSNVGGQFMFNFVNFTQQNNQIGSHISVRAHSRVDAAFPVAVDAFRIECTLSLVPKAERTKEVRLPDCSRNSTIAERNKVLTELLMAAMTEQHRFIDLVETSVASEWIPMNNSDVGGVSSDGKELLISNLSQKDDKQPAWLTTDQRSLTRDDRTPENGEEEPEVLMNSFLEHAFSIVPTVVLSSSSASQQRLSTSLAPKGFPVATSSPPSTTSSLPSSLLPPHPHLPVHGTDLPNQQRSTQTSITATSVSVESQQTNAPHKKASTKTAMTPPFRHRRPTLATANSVNSTPKASFSPFVRSSFSAPVAPQPCSWAVLNTGLLFWSILATLHWLWLLSSKVRAFVHRLHITSPTQKGTKSRGMKRMRERALSRWRRREDDIRKRRLVECPTTTDRSSSSSVEQRRKARRALRNIRRQNLLHRTMMAAAAPPRNPRMLSVQQFIGHQQLQQQQHRTAASASVHRQRQPKLRKAPNNLCRIREEEEGGEQEEGHRRRYQSESNNSGSGGSSSEEVSKPMRGNRGDGGRAQMAELNRQTQLLPATIPTDTKLFKLFC